MDGACTQKIKVEKRSITILARMRIAQDGKGRWKTKVVSIRAERYLPSSHQL